VEARLMRPRIEQELALLRQHYPDVEHLEHAGEDWFRIPRYSFPAGWRIGDRQIESAPIVFRITAAYPSSEPYGFLTPAGINFNGAPPGNTGSAPAVPFAGDWQHFSWAPDGSWVPTQEVRTGSNLLAWVRSFAHRLREGA
jgi:hypothetical protein